MRKVTMLILLLSWQVASATPTKLRVAFLAISPMQGEAVVNWVEKFEKLHPDIEVNIDLYSDGRYKQGFYQWLQEGSYDVLYWQAGHRLDRAISTEKLLPIDSLLELESLTRIYPKTVLNGSKQDGRIWGLPIGHYAWGFYYNKAIFQQLGLDLPSNWDAFIKLCETLKQSGVVPLVQPTEGGWPLLAWLDFLALETGGKALRHAIIHNQAIDEKDAQTISSKLAWVTNNDYLLSPENEWSWRQSIGAVARQNAAMTLSGLFAESIVTEQTDPNIGFFPFPLGINPKASIAPLEVLVVPKTVLNKAHAKLFLQFFIQSGVRRQLAFDLGWLPTDTNLEADKISNPRVAVAVEHLQKAQFLGHYFDREADQADADLYAELLKSLFTTGKSEYLQDALQKHSAPELTME